LNETFEVSLPENTIQQPGWFQLVAVDNDEGMYGTVTYRLTGADGLFQVDVNGYVLNNSKSRYMHKI